MAELNANVPHFECLVRDEFLYNQESGHGNYTKGVVIAIASIAGRAVGFHVLLQNGALVWRLPVSALCTKPCKRLEHTDLQLWDCFSYDVSVTEIAYLEGLSLRAWLKDGSSQLGSYHFTIDFYNSTASELAGDTGHKCFHLLALESGHFALQPNNRVQVLDNAWVKPFTEKPRYKTNQLTWHCELTPFETTDEYMYEIKQGE